MYADPGFYNGRKVFLTGHTGFKGAWMCRVLSMMGADVTGYALDPPTQPSLFALSEGEKAVHSLQGDVRDLEHLSTVMREVQPEIVIHMAAQPLVRESYREPVYTYETNVMGTVHLLEAVRQTPSVRSVVNVTTDKVYLNREWAWGYRENEELNGFDPYSNSKSCSELVTSCYRNSFFTERDLAVSTCRAGNVIGGGDFAKDRIIPDCLRAAEKRETIIVRNPGSTRPYQHVLEPVMGYLLVAQEQLLNRQLAGSYNIGPDEVDCVTTGCLTERFCRAWEKQTGYTAGWAAQGDAGPHEANFLKLDCSKIKSRLGWQPRWHIEEALRETVEWAKAWQKERDIATVMENQIRDFLRSA